MESLNKKYKFAKAGMILLTVLTAASLTWMIVKREQEIRAARAQEHIAEEVLRFHILANSDSQEDQALKMEVKELILGWMENTMPKGMDLTETKLWLKEHTDEAEALCEERIREQGYTYPVSTAVTTCYFPEKSYGDVTLPAGNYEALRIEIGAANGHNWWCVLYPNLCFVDAVHAVMPEESKQELERVLTEEEYDLCTSGAKFRVKSYFWECFMQ